MAGALPLAITESPNMYENALLIRISYAPPRVSIVPDMWITVPTDPWEGLTEIVVALTVINEKLIKKDAKRRIINNLIRRFEKHIPP